MPEPTNHGYPETPNHGYPETPRPIPTPETYGQPLTQQTAQRPASADPALTTEQNEQVDQALRLQDEGVAFDEAIATSEIVDRRPAAGWVEKPIAFRLVGKEQRAGHLTFVTEDTRDGTRKLERWWMPSATAASERVEGRVLRDMIDQGTDATLPLVTLQASSIDDDTLNALLSLPAQSFGQVLGEWYSMADENGTTAGE